MSLILLQLPKLKEKPDGRPNQCPYCGCEILQRWGRVTKPVTGRTDITAVIYRYKCRECKKTFRDYPTGIDRSGMTNSVRHLATILSALGLSSRKIQELFDRFGITLSHMTIWREGQELAKSLNGHKISNLSRNFPLDRHSILQLSHIYEVMLAINLDDGKYMVLGALDEGDPQGVLNWLRPLLKDAGILAYQLSTGKTEPIGYQAKQFNPQLP